MQIVIELSEEIYKNIIATWEQIHPQMHNALKNGILLPKGHGNLIDKESLINAIEQKAKRLENLDTINGLCGAVALTFEAETVIEADKEHNENEKV